MRVIRMMENLRHLGGTAGALGTETEGTRVGTLL